jgi:chorismate synthase
MKIEKDKVEILSGVRLGKTIGSPIAMIIRNLDWTNWSNIMSQEEEATGVEAITKPRPGHADLAGAQKSGQKDMRNILERASARETACRVAAGAVAKKLLAEFNITIFSHVLQIGLVSVSYTSLPKVEDIEKIENSEVRCFDAQTTDRMIEEINRARNDGDSVGGVFEVIAYGIPPGLGSYVSWDKRLDGKFAKALMSIPAIKGVEIGGGFSSCEKRGSEVHDEIFFEATRGFYRKTNRAGGLEGGMTNGEPLVLRAGMKPIPTLAKPLRTVDIMTKEPALAFKERSDVCAVPAAAVIGEAMIAIELVSAVLEKFGSDSLDELICNYRNYTKRIQNF